MEISIKSVTDDELILEGYGVVFDAHDFHGEKFEKDTEFFLENVKAIPVLWEHNRRESADILGYAKHVRTDDLGIVFEMALQRSNRYVGLVEKFVKMGRLGLSTGALPQTIVRDDDSKSVKRWQICEISATVEPAEFRTLGVNELS